MCLNKLDQVPYGDSDIGYKVLRKFETRREGIYYTTPCRWAGKLKMGDTIEDCNTKRITANSLNLMHTFTYPAGYHIFTQLKYARMYADAMFRAAVVQVRYSNKVASGYNICPVKHIFRDLSVPVVVARTMTLVREVERGGETDYVSS